MPGLEGDLEEWQTQEVNVTRGEWQTQEVNVNRGEARVTSTLTSTVLLFHVHINIH